MNEWVRDALAHWANATGNGPADLARRLNEQIPGGNYTRQKVNNMKVAAGATKTKPRRIQIHEALAISRITGHPIPPELLAELEEQGADASLLTRAARRLENIREAFAPDLPLVFAADGAGWLETINSFEVVVPTEMVMKIRDMTGLPSGYIAFGDPAGLSPAQFAKLLAAALNDPFG